MPGSIGSACVHGKAAEPVLVGLPTYGPRPPASTGAPAEHEDLKLALAGLRYVEVETSRYCNRKCSWCPNGHTGKRDVQQLMLWPLLEKVAAELGAAGFAGFLALHNYNEPLANPRLDQELELLHGSVPDARLSVYTNGDLLKRDRLQSLLAAGVRYVRVTRYPHRADVAPTEEALEKWLAQSGLAGALDWRIGAVRQGLAARWEDEATGALVEVIRPEVATYNYRGGSATVPVAAPVRTQPCQMTRTSLSIDYRGTVKMCCNVIPDSVPDHERYATGSIADTSLAELWNSRIMQDWRRLHGDADWSQSPACRTCVQALPETRRLPQAYPVPVFISPLARSSPRHTLGLLVDIALLHSVVMQLMCQVDLGLKAFH
jgi:radical SAM protein with 4Fe4S-binding SPASM domain